MRSRETLIMSDPVNLHVVVLGELSHVDQAGASLLDLISHHLWTKGEHRGTSLLEVGFQTAKTWPRL